MTSDTSVSRGDDSVDVADEDATAGSVDVNATTPAGSIVPFAGLLSLGAGAVHAAAAGIHAEAGPLARIFVVLAALQLGAGLFALLRPGRWSSLAVIGINVGAVIGWATTRLTGISWIEGLEQSESPQFADTACAGLGVAAAVVAGASLIGWRRGRSMNLAFPGVAVAALAVPAMLMSVTHVHASHGDDHGSGEVAAAADHHGDDSHDDGALAAAGNPVTPDSGHDAAAGDDHHATDAAAAAGDHGDDHATDDHATDDHHAAGDGDAADVESSYRPWPRPWDPAAGIDISDVEGVTPEQEARAAALIEETLVELPRWADTATALADGYTSIGDAGTGTEHYIRTDLIDDDILDPTAPESLVYQVDGDKRTLAGAMFIASPRPSDDTTLTDFGGPLMTWHKHDNLCWDANEEGVAVIVGLIDADGNCARGVRAGDAQPMVHVWITAHDCGPFAALEGVGAGTAAVSEEERVDKCQAEGAHDAHGDDHGGAAAVAPVPYDPTKPIDLGGIDGVTPAQQAAAENLVAVTVVRLPQWNDYKTAEAFGFRSIGDGGRPGAHEHFIQWEWINDDVILDPDAPESLVYEIQADGSRKLVSAMYMLPDDVGLDEVPDIGGPLMQWHIHDNLCFSTDPTQPRVAGITDAEGNCRSGLQKFNPAAMIHVWITPHKCGPFAALEGVGAGQILEGQERLCDEAHGAGH